MQWHSPSAASLGQVLLSCLPKINIVVVHQKFHGNIYSLISVLSVMMALVFSQLVV